jgi:hypothetical protein
MVPDCRLPPTKAAPPSTVKRAFTAASPKTLATHSAVCFMRACLKASSESCAAASVASAAVLPIRLLAVEVKDLVTSLQAETTGLRSVS